MSVASIFQHVKEELEDGNHELAGRLLSDLSEKIASKAERAVYDALYESLKHGKTEKKQPDYEADRLSEFEKRELIPGISIVSCCMNRNNNLLRAIKTWVLLPVDEIVIVDWSSTVPVGETLKHIEDDRIKIVRVENEPKWILTYGFNVGLRFSSYSRVYKLDADIEVTRNFLELNRIPHGAFVRGAWRLALDEGRGDQIFVNGSFGAFKKDLQTVGYYNELIRTYGWDDSDLYERLAAECGLGTRYLHSRSLLHMKQDKEERIKHQDVNANRFLRAIDPTEFNNQVNKFIGRTTDYWNTSRLQEYSIEKVSDGQWLCKRISENIRIPEYIIRDSATYAATHFLWSAQPQIIGKAESVTAFAELIYKQYMSKVPLDVTLTLLGEAGIHHDAAVLTDSGPGISGFLHESLEERSPEKLLFLLMPGDFYYRKRLNQFNAEILVLPKSLYEEVFSFRKRAGLPVEEFSLHHAVTDRGGLEHAIATYDRKVYVDAQHGLGNRLRAIGSAAAIAKKLDRELVIVWESDHHCECEFSDLFEYDGPVVDGSLLDSAKQTMDVFNYMEIEEGAVKDEEIRIDPNRDLYLRAAYTFNSPLSDWDSENEFIRKLRPVQKIRAMVDEFDLQNTIAAHVRMEAGKGLDHNTYDAVSNWTQEGHDQLHYWRDKSHYSHFMKRIDQLFAEDDSLRLFLATDMPETYKIFLEKYGDRLLYLKRDLFDRSRAQLVYALADALLLSKSSKLLGSTWSSFSELAMRLSTRYSSIEMSGKDF